MPVQFSGVYCFKFIDKKPENLDNHPVFRKWGDRARQALRQEAAYHKAFVTTIHAISQWARQENPSAMVPQVNTTGTAWFWGEDRPSLNPDVFLIVDDVRGKDATKYRREVEISGYGRLSEYHHDALRRLSQPETINVSFEAEYPNHPDYDPDNKHRRDYGIDSFDRLNYDDAIRHIQETSQVDIKGIDIQTDAPIGLPKPFHFKPTPAMTEVPPEVSHPGGKARFTLGFTPGEPE